MDKHQALTPDERVLLAERLGDEGLAAYMEAHGVDRQTAVARIKATRRLGRPSSVSAEADER
jgi:hypothetical protein